MNDSTPQPSMGDFIRFLRRQRTLVGLAGVICAATALVLSVTMTPVFSARASLLFEDQSAQLSVVGAPSSSIRTPAELAAIGIQLVVSPQVLQAVKDRLRTPLGLAQLKARMTVSEQTDSNLVLVEARDSNASFAEKLANAVAAAAVKREVDAQRGGYASAARDLRHTLRSLGKAAQDPITRSNYEDRIVRLQSLATIAEPVRIAQAAEIPSAPVSPKPVRNTVLAGVVGLLLGLLVAFFRDSLDRRLRGTDQIEKQLGLPVIGHVRRETLGTAGASATTPASNIDARAFEGFRILRTNLEFLASGRQLRSVLVTSSVPEEGKSTVAAWLAAAAAMAGRTTLLVECDLRQPSLAPRLGVVPDPGLSDYLSGSADPADILRTVAVGGHNARNGSSPDEAASSTPSGQLVCVMAGSMSSRPAELLGSDLFRDFIARVTDVYDLVVLDSSPLLPVADTREILPLVDGVVFCVREDRTTTDQVQAARNALSPVSELPIGIVVTGIRKSQERYGGYYAAESGYGY